MGRLLLLILAGAVIYHYTKERKELVDKTVKFNRDAADLRREREEEAGAKED